MAGFQLSINGRFWVSTEAMRRHIVKVDSTRRLEDLEGKTFGQLLAMFRSRCSDQHLNEWLENLRQLRNEVAHTFFRETELLTKELGEGYARLNHKVLRKGLRMTEICYVGLKKVEKNSATG